MKNFTNENFAGWQNGEKRNGKVNSRSEGQRSAEEKPFGMDCSFYRSMRDTYCTKTTVRQFVNDIISPRYKHETEEYRRLTAEGKEAEAKKIKENLPAFVAAGFCNGPHKIEKMTSFTGVTIIDIDHCGERTHEFIKILKVCRWVMAGWVSVSGEGLKALVRIDARNVDEYRRANEIVRLHIGRLLGFECDKQCSDPTRLSFTSHDPNAFYREDTECFNWRNEPAREESIQMPGSIPPTTQHRPVPPAEGMIDTFLSDFEAKFAYEKGKRNAWLLAIGRAARYRGMTQRELEILIGKVTSRADETCGAAEIRKKIQAGYGFVDGKFYEQAVFLGSQVPYICFPEEKNLEKEPENIDSEGDITDTTISALPYIPSWVYDNINQILLTITNVANTDRERDVLLCAALANLSACCPEVTFRYRDATYSPHLYFAAIGSAGSGKGVVAIANTMTDSIQVQMDREYEAQMVEYRKQKHNYDLQVERARKKGQRVKADEPTTPIHHRIKMAPTTSKSRMIEVLAENQKYGAIMTMTELDAIRSASDQKFGDFMEVVRMAFQHEEIAKDYKIDKQVCWVSHPRLAQSCAGTFAQWVRFIGNNEDGSVSRYLLYSLTGNGEFQSADPDLSNGDGKAIVRGISRDIKDMFNYLRDHPTNVKLTKAQWNKHTAIFQRLKKIVECTHMADARSIVFRYGLMMVRICAILTAMRKWADKLSFTDYYCDDTDFETACGIVVNCIKHSLALFTMLPDGIKEMKPAKSNEDILAILLAMPDEFTWSDFLTAMRREHFSRNACNKSLKNFVKNKFVSKKEGKYIKNHSVLKKALEVA